MGQHGPVSKFAGARQPGAGRAHRRAVASEALEHNIDVVDIALDLIEPRRVGAIRQINRSRSGRWFGDVCRSSRGSIRFGFGRLSHGMTLSAESTQKPDLVGTAGRYDSIASVAQSG